MPGVTRGEAGGREARCLCVQRGFFLLPRTSRRLSTPRRSHCATETCPCAGWVSIPSWEQRVRSARVGRGGAGAVRVPGGSCTSGVQCMAQLAAGTPRLPRAVRQKGRARGHKGTPTGTGEYVSFCDVLPRRGQRAAGRSAVRVPCSGRCGFAVAGRWSGALAAARRSAEQAHATRRADGTRVRTACMPLGRVGVRRRVGHVQLRGPCVCGHGVGGVARRKSARHTRAVAALRSRLVPHAASVGNHCVCATQPGAGCGVCSSRGRGWERGAGEKGARTRRDVGGGGPPHVQRRVRATAGLEEGAPWSQRDARRSATASLAGGGITSGRKIAQLVFQSREAGRGAGGVRLDRGPSPSCGRVCRTPHTPGQKREKGGRPKGTDSRGGAPDARPKPTLFKTTRCAQSPRRRACYKVFRLRLPGGQRLAVGRVWALERALRRRPPPSRCAGARERRGTACADHLPDIFPPFPVNGYSSGRESGSLAGIV